MIRAVTTLAKVIIVKQPLVAMHLEMYPGFVPQLWIHPPETLKEDCPFGNLLFIGNRLRKCFNQLSNVFGSPSGATLRKLNRLRKPTCVDPLPPACLAKRDDTQNLR